MLSHVFAGTSKCKSWTGTGVFVPVDRVDVASATLDCDFICDFLWLFKWSCGNCVKLTAPLVETFDTVLEVEWLGFVDLDVGNQG